MKLFSVLLIVAGFLAAQYSPPSGGGGGAPSGPAGGSLAGTYPNPSLAIPIQPVVPWIFAPVSGVTGAYVGTPKLTDGSAISFAVRDAPANGQVMIFVPDVTNTTGVSFTINGIDQKNALWGPSGTSVIPAGGVVAHVPYAFMWDSNAGTWALTSTPGLTTAGTPYLTANSTVSGPVFALTKPPNVSALTWVNQGGATASTTANGALLLSFPTGADIVRFLRTASYPSTPFTAVIGMALNFDMSSTFQTYGIAISDGTKYAGFGTGVRTANAPGSISYTFATAGGGGSTIGAFPNLPMTVGSLWFISLTDDGTNITVSMGPNPLQLQQIGTATRSTLGLTPTQIGVWGDNSSANMAGQILIVHWAGF